MENTQRSFEAMKIQWVVWPSYPKTLQKISCEVLGKMLLSIQQGTDYLNEKENLRTFFSPLPSAARQELIKTTSNLVTLSNGEYDARTIYPTTLFILEVLFTNSVQELEAGFRPNFRKAHLMKFLKFIAEEGEGLHTLQMKVLCPEFKHNLGNTQIWKNALLTARNLIKLDLGRHCNDEMLKGIGQNCHALRELAMWSSDISNMGLTWLTQNIVKVDSHSIAAGCDWESTLWKLPEVFLPLSKLIPVGKSVKCYERRKNPLCDTLKILKFGMPKKISYRGLREILELVPNMENLDFYDFDKFINNLREMWERCAMEEKGIQFPSLKLKTVLISSLNDQVILLLNKLCPELQHFTHSPYLFQAVPVPSVPLKSFNSFEYLDSLEIQLNYRKYVDEDINELSSHIRERLKILDLQNSGDSDPISLYYILQKCPVLHTLRISFTLIIWDNNDPFREVPQRVLFEALTHCSVNKNVSAEAVFELLWCAPNLEDIHTLDVVERPENFVARLCNIRTSPALQVFHVYTGYFLSTEEELKYFLSHFHKIRYVGRFPFNTGHNLLTEMLYK